MSKRFVTYMTIEFHFAVNERRMYLLYHTYHAHFC